ncbi:MAG TPA: lysylphosphatidylglycerol synthase transmembrane domain-containing protein [Candidatus Nitrosopolaris sp.]|nr:lysylphosphatidylglycerol synthase transmembrane domain-containing protein [Candidatus Nitrosopolaris sp.]
MRLGPAARRSLRIAVSLAIAVYILVHVDRGDLRRALAGVRPGLFAAALLLYVAGQVLSAYKWAVLGRSVGLDRSLLEYTRFYFIGMFFNLFGPSTIGGDVVRALYLGDGRRRRLALNSVLFDRASGLALMMALGATGLLLFPSYGFPWPLTLGIGGGGAALLLGWWMCPRLVRWLPERSRMRGQVENELAPFWRDRRLLLRIAMLSLAFHLTQVGVQWILARGVGADLPLSYCTIVYPVVSLLTALPVSVAGLGVREGGYLYFLTRIDIDDSIAVTLGLAWFAVTVLAGLLGGVLFLASGAPLPRLRAEPTERAA